MYTPEGAMLPGLRFLFLMDRLLIHLQHSHVHGIVERLGPVPCLEQSEYIGEAVFDCMDR